MVQLAKGRERKRLVNSSTCQDRTYQFYADLGRSFFIDFNSMKLTRQAIREFQEIYKEEFGKNIDVVKAERLGINLLSLMKSIYRQIPIKEINK